MPAKKNAKVIRTADEFNRLNARIASPPPGGQDMAWSNAKIRAARDAMIGGSFQQSAQLAKAVRTEAALLVPYSYRLAPQAALDVEIEPSSGAPRAKQIAGEAEPLFGRDGIATKEATMSDIAGNLANFGFAVAINYWQPREDGSRTDVEHHSWPMEFAEYDKAKRQLFARVDPATAGGESRVPITHGDGTWTVYASHEVEPWTQEACILAAGPIWAAIVFAERDWNKASVAHGNAKAVGTMPPNTPLENSDGTATTEANAMVTAAQSMVSHEAAAIILPAEGKMDYVVNSSSAWQVFEQRIMSAEKKAARLYLGTDAILGSQGGSPGVDIVALFKVAGAKIEQDLRTLSRGLREGLIEPWTAINFGDSALAPIRRYLVPDVDAQQSRRDYAERQDRLQANIKAARENGFVIDQEWVDEMARKLDVEAPRLPVVTAYQPPQTPAQSPPPDAGQPQSPETDSPSDPLAQAPAVPTPPTQERPARSG